MHAHSRPLARTVSPPHHPHPPPSPNNAKTRRGSAHWACWQTCQIGAFETAKLRKAVGTLFDLPPCPYASMSIDHGPRGTTRAEGLILKTVSTLGNSAASNCPLQVYSDAQVRRPSLLASPCPVRSVLLTSSHTLPPSLRQRLPSSPRCRLTAWPSCSTSSTSRT